MDSLGCIEALMLDCSSTSIIMADLGLGLHALNRPQYGFFRPIPVLIGIQPSGKE